MSCSVCLQVSNVCKQWTIQTEKQQDGLKQDWLWEGNHTQNILRKQNSVSIEMLPLTFEACDLAPIWCDSKDLENQFNCLDESGVGVGGGNPTEFSDRWGGIQDRLFHMKNEIVGKNKPLLFKTSII